MKKRSVDLVRSLALTLTLVAASYVLVEKSRGTTIEDQTRTRVVSAVALPLVFEANRGQADKRVNFLVRRPGYTLFLTADQAVHRIVIPPTSPQTFSGVQRKGNGRARAHTLRMRLRGTRSGVRPKGVDLQQGIVNHLHGNDPRKWRTGVPTFGRVEYPDLVPGVDLAFYSSRGRLRYDIRVAPNADPDAIRLTFTGATNLQIDDRGNLVLDTPAGTILHTAPSLYQTVGGRRVPVDGGFVLKGPREVGVRVGTWNRTASLIIDPEVVFGTYFGGTAGEVCGSALVDGAMDVDVNASDQVFITGCTYSTDFPDTDQPAGDPQEPGTNEVFVFRVDMAPDNSATLGYSTYFGGTGADGGTGVAALDNGQIYISGYAGENFPIVGDAFQPAFGGPGDHRGFIAKLDNAGVISRSTYLGTSSRIVADAIAVDAGGGTGFDPGVYVAGHVFDDGQFQPEASGLPINGALEAAPFKSTFGGGSSDGFVAKLSLDLSQTAYFTYLGGLSTDRATDIAVREGNAYVTGRTASFDFPTANGAQTTAGMGFDDPDCRPVGLAPTRCFDAFYVRLNRGGTDLEYGTFFGGTGPEFGHGIGVDSNGKVFLAGQWQSTQPDLGTEAFIAALENDASPWIPDYLGGSGNDGALGMDMAVDAGNQVHLTGDTNSSDMDQNLGVMAPEPFQGVWDAFYLRHRSPLADFLYVGGSGPDIPEAIAADAAGAAYIVGWTGTGGIAFPGAALPDHQTPNGSDTEIFLVKIGEPSEAPVESLRQLAFLDGNELKGISKNW